MNRGGRRLRCAIFEAGAGGKTISLPVTGILAVVTATFGARIDPHRLSCRYYLTAGCISITVGTLLALRAAFPSLVLRIDTGWRGAVCHETAGNAITVTSALLAF